MTGGLCTFAILVICLAYGALKFAHLMNKYNPDVAEVTDPFVFTSEDKMNLNEKSFRFAFTIEGYLDRAVKDDPAFVKYIVRVLSRKDGKEYERLLPFHKC